MPNLRNEEGGLDSLRITAFIHGNPPKRYVEELAKRKAGLATKCESLSAKRHSTALAILPCPDGAGV